MAADLPDWAQSDRGEVVGFYDSTGSWVHSEEGEWRDNDGNLHDGPTEVDLQLSDSITVIYTNSAGDTVYATFHGGVDDVFPLDDAIADLDARDSGEPA